MIKFFKVNFPVLVLMLLLSPYFALAEQRGDCTYPAGGKASGYTQAQCKEAGGTWAGSTAGAAEDTGLVPCDQNCDFNKLMDLVNNVINFIFVRLTIPIVAILFAYAGVLLVTAGEESASAKTKAKGILTNAVVGFLIMAVSWVIIHSILVTLGFNGSWIGL